MDIKRQAGFINPSKITLGWQKGCTTPGTLQTACQGASLPGCFHDIAWRKGSLPKFRLQI